MLVERGESHITLASTRIPFSFRIERNSVGGVSLYRGVGRFVGVNGVAALSGDLEQNDRFTTQEHRTRAEVVVDLPLVALAVWAKLHE